MYRLTLTFLVALYASFNVAQAQCTIFFSEYAEGSGNNKYLEIYNPTSDTVNLSAYAYPSVSNAPSTIGVYEWWNDFDAGAIILPNDVYIIAHASADPSILALADETHNYLSNGDDGYALVYGSSSNYVIIDFIGDWNGDPGDGWTVSGLTNATKDHVLVRKCNISQGNNDWSLSSGTDATSSEWLVLNIDDWTNLGSHLSLSSNVCPTYIFGCIDTNAFNYAVYFYE